MESVGALPADMAEVAARLPDRYRLVTEISRSAMSVVYLAEELAVPRRVALKVLAPRVADDPAFRDRFTRELEIAARLEHPNVIPVYAAEKAGGTAYLAMRLVEGDDLAARAARGPMPLDETVEVLTQVADALDAAHRAGLVHRDVKPGNVLVDGRTGHVYLCDFGIATRVTGSDGLTATGSLLGTIDYVAPEQVQGRPVDGSADVYALGAVLFRCLAGRPPFVGEPAAVLWSHVNAPRPKLQAHRPDLPARLDAVLARAMAKDPAQRHPTCRSLVDEVRAAAPASPPSPRRRLRVPLAAGAVLAMALAVVLAVVLLPGTLPARVDPALLDRVPAALRADCVAADPPAGATQALRCRDAAGQEVAVGLYAAAAGSDRVYDEAVAAAGPTRATGDCALAVGAEHRYPGVGSAVGRLSCRHVDGSSRLVWTDRTARTVATADRGDGDDLQLYRAWAGWVGIPAYPAPEERDLVALLPERECRRAPASSLDGRAGAVAAVDCEPLGTSGTPRSVRYVRFVDPDALRRGYDAVVAAGPGPPKDDRCLGSKAKLPGEGVRDLRSATLGRMVCRIDAPGAVSVTWTSEPLSVLGQAGGTDPALMLGWLNDGPYGPRLSQEVRALAAAATPAFPSEAERALLAVVPETSQLNCVRPSPTQVQSNVGEVPVLAVVACEAAGGPGIVFYYQFADSATLARVVGAPSAGADCTTGPPGFSGSARYTRPDGTTGWLFCGTQPTGRTSLEWTAEQRSVLGLAFTDGDPAAMLAWWQRAGGPLR